MNRIAGVFALTAACVAGNGHRSNRSCTVIIKDVRIADDSRKISIAEKKIQDDFLDRILGYEAAM